MKAERKARRDALHKVYTSAFVKQQDDPCDPLISDVQRTALEAVVEFATAELVIQLKAANDRITDLQLEPACLAADNIELQGKLTSLEKENRRLLSRCESLNVQLQRARGTCDGTPNTPDVVTGLGDTSEPLAPQDWRLIRWCVLTVSKGFTAEHDGQIAAHELLGRLDPTTSALTAAKEGGR